MFRRIGSRSRARGSHAAACLKLGLLALWGVAAGAGRADTLFVNNGLAPPNPENVISSDATSVLIVRNVNCLEGDDPCLAPLAPSSVEITGDVAGLEYRTSDAQVWDSSLLQISGGRIGSWSGSSSGYLRVYDQASVVMTAGRVRLSVYANDRTQIELDGGIVRGSVSARDLSQVWVRGATIDSGLSTRGAAMITFESGYLPPDISASEWSRILLLGGSPSEEAESGMSLRAWNHSVIEIVGSGFEVDGVPAPFGAIAAVSGRLTGFLASGDPIDIDFLRGGPYLGTIVLSEQPTALPDEDLDGVPNIFDVCRFVSDPLQEDRDLNGRGDACNDAEDRDGDEYADDRDTCPDLFDLAHEDTDRNGIGDLCNDGLDLDGDEFEDQGDNCPTVFSLDQLDSDRDSLGDACDLFPTDPYNLGAQIELELALEEVERVSSERDQARAELNECRADPPYFDEDGDGEHDRTDACPGTGTGVAVDGEGCSLAQFCTAAGGHWWGRGVRCRKADWRNDEPFGRPRDCRMTWLAHQCVPR